MGGSGSFPATDLIHPRSLTCGLMFLAPSLFVLSQSSHRFVTQGDSAAGPAWGSLFPGDAWNL